MARENLHSSEVDRELLLSDEDSDSVSGDNDPLSSSNEDIVEQLFGDDTDEDPTYTLPGVSGIGKNL